MSSPSTTSVSDDGRTNSSLARISHPTVSVEECSLRAVARSWRFGLMSLLLASCAHYDGKALELETGTAGFVRQRDLDDLHVAIKDLSSPRDSVKYFDRELIAYGYVPVLVALQLDGSSDATFDMSRQDMRLVLKSGQRLESAEPDETASDVAFSHWRTAFGFLFLLPGPFVASSVSHANQELEGDYQDKCLDSIRINSQLRSHQGVVFFKIREELRDSFDMEDAFLEVKIYKQGKGDELGRVIDLPVHFR